VGGRADLTGPRELVHAINRSGSGHHGQHNGQVLIHVVSIWGLAHPASQPPARNSTTTGSNMRLYP